MTEFINETCLIIDDNVDVLIMLYPDDNPYYQNEFDLNDIKNNMTFEDISFLVDYYIEKFIMKEIIDIYENLIVYY